LGKFEAAQLISELDKIIEQVVENLRINGQELLEKTRKQEAELQKQKKINEFKQQYGEMGLEGKPPNPDDQYLESEELMDDYKEFEYKKYLAENGEDEEKGIRGKKTIMSGSASKSILSQTS
jgi:5'-3' exonuclease